MSRFSAELLLIRKRASTWLLLGVAAVLTTVFGYVLPYGSYVSNTESERIAADLEELLPGGSVATALGGFPVYVGLLALVLGALSFGSEYTWGTMKTVFMQRPDRVQVVLAKVAALASILLAFVATVFLVSTVASLVVASLEGRSLTGLPPLWDYVRAVGAGWLILLLWAMLGAVVSVISRGIALAIGLGIIYGFFVEGLVTNFGSDLQVLEAISRLFMRTNAYSLVEPIGATFAEEDEPGAFSGPFVEPLLALGMIVAYIAAFTGLSALLIRRRDVT
jgi:ABC-2 type transport system permease protein